jgi:hypothetical protein
MSEQVTAATIICSEYQRLLKEFDQSMEIWDERRAEICRSRLFGEETGDELLRLQAKYARAYTLLRKHAQTCLRCEPMRKVA